MPDGSGDGPPIGSGGLFTWPVVARIWRTVDVERTVAELGLPPESLDPDELLGGQGVLVRPEDGAPVAILEPSTEGRLAATLARHGEGDAGLYVAPAGGLSEARNSAWILSREASGPFGTEALLLMPAEHPLGTAPMFVVIVDAPAATIEP